MKPKHIIIPSLIIGFVAYAGYKTAKKRRIYQTEWLKNFIDNDNATATEKQAGKLALEQMRNSEINTLYIVLSYPDKSLINAKLKADYAKISQKYNVFT